MRSLSLLLIGLTVAVAGCHSEGVGLGLPLGDGGVSDANVDQALPGDGGGDAAVPQKIVTASMFLADYAQALCSQEQRCGLIDSSTSGNTTKSMAACLEQATQLFPLRYDIDSEILKGRIQFNELQCIQATMDAQCDGTDNYFVNQNRCGRFLYLPMQGSGGACVTNEECQAGLACKHTLADGGVSVNTLGCAGGSCQAAGNPGDGCTIDLTSYHNDCNSTIATCGMGYKCAALGAAGATCTSLSGSGGCQPELFCKGLDFDSATSGICTKPAATPAGAGAACDPAQYANSSSEPCADGYYCSITRMGGVPHSGTCTAKIAATGACDPAAVLTGSPCADGASCYQGIGDAGPVCQPLKQQNQPCSDNTQCATGLYCVGAPTGHCDWLIADGQPCNPNDTCPGNGFGGCCVSTLNGPGCLPVPDGGANDGTCTPWKNFNATCTPSTDNMACATQLCSSTNGRCALSCPM